ncbi:MAG: endonuclease/exonuclease/phosphatase family protein [Saprospiraceae bacterium]|nr:endonuclease/exonuclease/phosphatase family protein [Saprospiraceae bacterium]
MRSRQTQATAVITERPPVKIQTELDALRVQLNKEIPAKRLEQNLLIATWNIRAFGDVTRKWASDADDSPKRDLHAVSCIAEILSHFDVVALQEVKGNIRALRDVLRLLGNHWGLILTDVNRGAAGNDERMAFLFDTRRVQLSGLACELVVPQEQLDSISQDALQRQFARTPYAVGFRSAGTTFVLVTLHILFGSGIEERIPELKAIARWMSDWAKDISDYEQNLLALGDFNIDARGDALAQTFLSEGLHIPPALESVTRSIFDETKFYDHIAWFDGSNGQPKLSMEFVRGGNFDFVGKVLKARNLSRLQLSFMLSDHYPLWAEFALPAT